MKVLILSPHRDDAGFSLSLSIAHWLTAGHRVTLLNIFTRSLYAPYSDADTVAENDRLSYVSAMRKKEDDSFVKRMPGLAMLDLNLKDAPIRLRCSSDTVCEVASSAEDTAISKIQKAVGGHVSAPHFADAVVLPLALGHHVDHRVTRDAALSLSSELPMAFYEDLPYATREGAYDELVRFQEDSNIRLRPVLVHSSQSQPVTFKLKMVSLYASQIDRQMAETIANFSHQYKGAERLWANDLWLSRAVPNGLSTLQADQEAGPLT